MFYAEYLGIWLYIKPCLIWIILLNPHTSRVKLIIIHILFPLCFKICSHIIYHLWYQQIKTNKMEIYNIPEEFAGFKHFTNVVLNLLNVYEDGVWTAKSHRCAVGQWLSGLQWKRGCAFVCNPSWMLLPWWKRKLW